MKNNFLKTMSRIGCATVLFTLSALAQDHPWAGRTLDNFEWTIHERLAGLPSYGVFDTVRFETQGKTVVLSGQVVKESAKQNAERMVRQLDGVQNVVNRIEVLPSSRRDDALRMNVYRAIYEKQPLEKYGTRAAPPIHILVKDGWVTLEGVVDSDADRNMVHRRALQASAHVSDNLRVAPEEQ
ncbi:MAG: BON domain-containing protein [Bryobacteraceae bacterium]